MLIGRLSTNDSLAGNLSASGSLGGRLSNPSGGADIPSEVRNAILALFESAAYAETGLTDEIAIIQSWAAEVTSLTLSPRTLSLNGDTPQTITATVVPSSASVVWSSSDTSIATVVGGVVTGVSNGSCTITASAGTKSATCAVTVTGFVELVSISAVYTQSGTVYDTDSLDDLKADLVVTATYSDSTTETITDYVLSGTLAEGTSTITVSYGGKTTTFNVTVTTALLYSFSNHVFDGTSSTAIDTNIALTSTDQDFTILFDLTTTVSQDSQGELVYRLVNTVQNVSNHNRGVSIVKGSTTTQSMFRWCDTATSFTDFNSNFIGNAKFAVRHAQGSGYATLDVKAGNNNAHQYTASSAFYPSAYTLKFGTNESLTNALFGTASGKVYNVYLSDESITEFLMGA